VGELDPGGGRKNKLYQAFSELGRLVWTVFLLNFIGDKELRRTVMTATNTSETWNGCRNGLPSAATGSSGRTAAKSSGSSSAIITS
jgi:Tn3 transposase DDE domain